MMAAADWSQWKRPEARGELDESVSSSVSRKTWQSYYGWQRSAQVTQQRWQGNWDSEWRSHDPSCLSGKCWNQGDSWQWKNGWCWHDDDDNDHNHSCTWDERLPSTDFDAEGCWQRDEHVDNDNTSIIPSISAGEVDHPLVLVLGLPKCGTTSLHAAFQSAGFWSVHWALDAGLDKSADKRLRERSENAHSRLIALLIQRAISENLPPLAHLPHRVDAVAEMNGLTWVVDANGRRTGQVDGCFPQMQYLEELVRYYPHAHFILNFRDPWKWVKSVDAHNDMRKRLVAADIPGLPQGYGSDDRDMVAWVESHHARVKSLLAQKGSRLLEFDIERHGERELSAFLHRTVSWGHFNKTQD